MKQKQPEKKCESCLAGFSREDIGGNCTCSQPPVLEWEKEFDYLVDPENYCDCGNINLDIEKVKGFIVKTMQSVRNATLEEAAEVVTKSIPPSSFLDDAQLVIRSLKK